MAISFSTLNLNKHYSITVLIISLYELTNVSSLL